MPDGESDDEAFPPMSLATRCTACGTVFRVVQDQLKVSDGWVRCGRCDAVFNAGEGLFDLEREAPPPWSPTQPPGEPPAGADDDAYAGRGAPERFAPAPGDVDAAATPAVPHDFVSAALARHADELAGRSAPLGSPHEPAVDDRSAWAPEHAAIGLGEPARTFRPSSAGGRTTAWLATAAALLAVLLGAQIVAQSSEVAAARWPGLQPVLARWCAVAGCSVAAPRRIEEIVVESSALAPVIGTDALKLGLSLRNRANHAVALPSVDLSLTDSGGRLIARRTLAPADFRATAVALPPGTEVPFQALIAAGTAAVTGYTVEIFYP